MLLAQILLHGLSLARSGGPVCLFALRAAYPCIFAGTVSQRTGMPTVARVARREARVRELGVRLLVEHCNLLAWETSHSHILRLALLLG